MAGKDIGALWIKRSSKGEYLSGSVEIDGKKHFIVCFLNSYKKETKHPDYKIYPSEPRPRTDAEDREYDKKADAAMAAEEAGSEPNTDDIPF